MKMRTWLFMALAIALLDSSPVANLAPACCPAPPHNKPVVNADQTIVMIWDKESRTQHFIRQASFKSDAEDFGFLIPSPTEPELSESGNDAFTYLAKLTEPEKIKQDRPAPNIGCGCAAQKFEANATGDAVRVLQDKMVAGYNAMVLEADSATALTDWLNERGYAYSPEVRDWAEPYVKNGWKITALKVAKKKDEEDSPTVNASALRMTFKTETPLFPYREPKSDSAAESLGAKRRLLRIFFIADARYKGAINEADWKSTVAWSNKVDAADRKKLLETLKLPETTGPANWWLTEFEHQWPYELAKGDVLFVRDSVQDAVKRPPHIVYVRAPGPGDVVSAGLAAVILVPFLFRRLRRR